MEPSVGTIPGSDGLPLTVYRWEPAGPPRALVQVTHGMGEHARRYGELAQQLSDNGYLVLAQDHRGHGASAVSEAELGVIGAEGWTALVEDIATVTAAARSDTPDLPVVLFAHSMGSFAAQQYLPRHGDDLSGAYLTGTAALDLLEPALDLDTPLDLSAFNAPFLPARTDYDWLSRDPDQVDAYVADPYCGFGLDLAAGRAMFEQARPLADLDVLRRIPAGLPIRIAVGEADPVNAGLALVTPIVERYRAAGLTDVTLRTFPGARHELTNETNRQEVFDDLVTWLDRVLPGR